jgi:hypothetical protein
MINAKSSSISTGKNIVAGNKEHKNIKNTFPLTIRSNRHFIQDKSFFYFRLIQLFFSGSFVEVLRTNVVFVYKLGVEDQIFLCFNVSSELVFIRLKHIHTKESSLFTVDQLIVL